MQFSWHLIIIIAAILIGVALYQKGIYTPSMSPEQAVYANMYRQYAYALWGIAVAVAVYYYYINSKSRKASMHGGLSQYATMHHGVKKAYMCGMKAHMCGAKH